MSYWRRSFLEAGGLHRGPAGHPPCRLLAEPRDQKVVTAKLPSVSTIVVSSVQYGSP